eukprot:3044064-Rhodomonas_salina.5
MARECFVSRWGDRGVQDRGQVSTTGCPCEGFAMPGTEQIARRGACRDIPIVHRVIKVHEKYDGAVDVLTKGDNNDVDDRGLYAPSLDCSVEKRSSALSSGVSSRCGVMVRGAAAVVMCAA